MGGCLFARCATASLKAASSRVPFLGGATLFQRGLGLSAPSRQPRGNLCRGGLRPGWMAEFIEPTGPLVRRRWFSWTETGSSGKGGKHKGEEEAQGLLTQRGWKPNDRWLIFFSLKPPKGETNEPVRFPSKLNLGPWEIYGSCRLSLLNRILFVRFHVKSVRGAKGRKSRGSAWFQAKSSGLLIRSTQTAYSALIAT